MQYVGHHVCANLNDGYLGSGTYLKRAIRKYGISSFEREIIAVYNNMNDMLLTEAKIVNEEFCSRSDTYNICPGGRGGFSYINASGLNGTKAGVIRQGELQHDRDWKYYWRKMRSDAIRAMGPDRLKETHKKRVENIRLKHGPLAFHTFRGKVHNDKTKAAIGAKTSISSAGAGNSQYGTCWVTRDGVNMKIKKTDLSEWVANGFTRGRVMKKA